MKTQHNDHPSSSSTKALPGMGPKLDSEVQAALPGGLLMFPGGSSRGSVSLTATSGSLRESPVVSGA